MFGQARVGWDGVDRVAVIKKPSLGHSRNKHDAMTHVILVCHISNGSNLRSLTPIDSLHYCHCSSHDFGDLVKTLQQTS